MCDDAARHAANQTGVPLAVLQAVTRVETGRDGADGLMPWPWAVNEGGDSHWFDSETEAVVFVQTALDAGLTNIDVGCFQLNHRWHGNKFATLDAMFDPDINALEAAQFLADLASKAGDWRSAVAAYHSRTPDHANRYLARFDAVMAAMAPDATTDTLPDPQTRVAENRYPLLQAGLRGSAGSLVPQLGSGQPLFRQVE